MFNKSGELCGLVREQDKRGNANLSRFIRSPECPKILSHHKRGPTGKSKQWLQPFVMVRPEAPQGVRNDGDPEKGKSIVLHPAVPDRQQLGYPAGVVTKQKSSDGF